MRNYDKRIFKIKYDKAFKIYINDMNIKVENDKTEKRFSLYTSLYPYMLLGQMKGMEFSDFNDMLDGKQQVSSSHKVDMIDEEDALKMIEELKKRSVVKEIHEMEEWR